MAEQLSSNHETEHRHEHEPQHEAEHHKSVEHHKHHEEHDEKQIEQLKHKAEAEAKSSKETPVEAKQVKQAHSYLVGKELKQDAFKRSLNRTRKQLSKPNRAFSKVVHQPVVDTISRAGAQTVARPKGLLTGSILALAGSSYLLWSAKHYGYKYNYLVVILLFASGYILGLVIELLWFTLRPKKR